MWVTKCVPIELIGFTPRTYNDINLPKALEYAKLPPDNAPAIDVIEANGRYEMAHGFHRLAAAWIRGDKEVKVHFWEKSSADPTRFHP